MCKCTPSIRTPFCGKAGCRWPEEEKPQKINPQEKYLEDFKYCKQQFAEVCRSTLGDFALEITHAAMQRNEDGEPMKSDLFASRVSLTIMQNMRIYWSLFERYMVALGLEVPEIKAPNPEDNGKNS